MLSFPAGKVDGTIVFKCKDIKDISPEEFIDWLNFVYPGNGLTEHQYYLFEDVSSRIRTFQSVLSFWVMWWREGVQPKIKTETYIG